MTHRSRLGGLIIDCQTDDLAVAEAFWTRALGFPAVESSAPEDAAYVPLKSPPGMHVELQRVSHPSRVHIDIESDDVDAEATRLEKLGAKKLEKIRSWWVMEAPTGHRFCVIPVENPNFEGEANCWDD